MALLLKTNFTRKLSKKITFAELKKSKALDFHLTSDLYRIDIGLILSRCPIYMKITKEQLDMEKSHYNIFKNKQKDISIREELRNYNLYDPLALIKGRTDEEQTHE